MKTKIIISIIAVLFMWMAGWQPLFPAEENEPAFELKQVSGDVYCLYGRGGNIGVLKGEDGFLLVDAQFKDTAPKVKELLAGLGAKPIKYLINTHYHYDHTNGTPALSKDAELIMHPNCIASTKKLLEEKPETAMEAAYLSKVTPWTEGKSIKMSDETVKLLYLGNGHTSGDLVVVFEKAKVLHMGDRFFNGMCPYIDVKDGSDTENWIRTIKTICEKYPDYKMIPGHGEVTDAAGYLKFADYLTLLRQKVSEAIKAGKTKEEAMESIKLEGYENLSEYGTFITRKTNIGWVYEEMTR